MQKIAAGQIFVFWAKKPNWANKAWAKEAGKNVIDSLTSIWDLNGWLS